MMLGAGGGRGQAKVDGGLMICRVCKKCCGLCGKARSFVLVATAGTAITAEMVNRRRLKAAGHGFDPEKLPIIAIANITAISAALLHRGGLPAMIGRRSERLFFAILASFGC